MMLSLFEVVEKRRHPGCDCATVSTAVRSSDDDYQSNQTEAEATMATPSNTDVRIPVTSNQETSCGSRASGPSVTFMWAWHFSDSSFASLPNKVPLLVDPLIPIGIRVYMVGIFKEGCCRLLPLSLVWSIGRKSALDSHRLHCVKGSLQTQAVTTDEACSHRLRVHWL